jgi:hypothetical protein
MAMRLQTDATMAPDSFEMPLVSLGLTAAAVVAAFTSVALQLFA